MKKEQEIAFSRAFFNGISGKQKDILENKTLFIIEYGDNKEEIIFLLDTKKIIDVHTHDAENLTKIKNKLEEEWEKFCERDKISDIGCIKKIRVEMASE